MARMSLLVRLFLAASISISAAAPVVLSATSGPSPRLACRLVYDPVNERLMMFGGMTFVNRQVFGDTWILDLSQANPDWRQAGSAPQPDSGTTTGIDGFPAETIFLGVLAFLLYTSFKRRMS